MKRTPLSVFLAFLAMLALSVFLTAQQPTSSPQQRDQGSQPAAESQSDSSQQGSPQSSDRSTQDPSGQSDPGKQMPKTASNLPLVALLALTALGVGAAAHRYSRRYGER